MTSSHSQHVNEEPKENPDDYTAEGIDIPWLEEIIHYDPEHNDWYDVDPGRTPDTVKGPWPIDEDKNDEDNDDDENLPPDNIDGPGDSDGPPNGFFPIPIPIDDENRGRVPQPSPLPGFAG